MDLTKNHIVAISLEKIAEKIKNNEIEEGLVNKIYSILFESYNNCLFEDKTVKDTINYTFLGWWIYENLRESLEN